ncbi:hypothetical protein NDA01_26555 [Trichocoleus desertorum AS-A10]
MRQQRRSLLYKPLKQGWLAIGVHTLAIALGKDATPNHKGLSSSACLS